MIDPRTRILLLFYAGLLAISLEHATALGLLTGASCLALLRSGIDRKWLKTGALVVAAVVWSTTFSQALFYGAQPRTPWISIGPVVFWQEGIEHGLVQSLRLLSVTLAGLALAISTSPDRLLVAMTRLGAPESLAFLAVTALRFVPTVGGEFQSVRHARRHRGRPVWSRPLWEWLRLEVHLLRPVVARALRRARALAESLDARGYDPQAGRTSRQGDTWSQLDTWLLTFATLFVAFILKARSAYMLYTLDISYHPALGPIYGLVRHWL